MENLQIFKNAEFGEIRTIEENGKVLFCGSDVAKSLGYVKPQNAILKHCRYASKRSIPHPQSKTKTIEMLFVPEGDIYRLASHSELPSAERFESWVFDEVLPSIRKNGGYILGQEELTEEELMAKALVVAQNKIAEKNNKIKSLETDLKMKDQVIGELKPKADYTDTILKNTGLVTITQIAKDYGISGKEMNKRLHKLGVQYNQSGQWLLYSKYHNKGYTHSETIEITRSNGMKDVTMNTKWTQKGRLFLYELLKKNGYVPVIEQVA